MCSWASSQDLLTERQRMEERIQQLQLRQDFLNSEMDRFRVGDSGGTAR